MVKPLTIPNRDDDTVLPDQSQPSNKFVSHDQIIYFAGQLAKADADRKAANRAYSKVRKMFKNTGVSLGIFDIVSRLSEQEDEDALEKWFDEMVWISQAYNMLPPGTQTDLFTGSGSVIEARDKAFKLGRIHALSERMEKSPYDPASDLGQEYLRGYNDGQSERGRLFIAHSEKVREEEAAIEAKRKEAAKRKEERAAKRAEKEGRTVPTTEDGDTVQ